MPLTMRPTGLSSPIDKHLMDYTGYSGEWPMGRIYQERGAREDLRWVCRCSVSSLIRPKRRPTTVRQHLRPQKQSSKPIGGDGFSGRSWPRSILGSKIPEQSLGKNFCRTCDGHHRQRLNTLLCMQGDLEMTKDIIVAVAITFAVLFAILAAKVAESGNDRASNPTISTLPLQY
jgi:hypothetical protein